MIVFSVCIDFALSVAIILLTLSKSIFLLVNEKSLKSVTIMPATLAALAAGGAPADAVRLWRDAEVYAAHSM